MWADYYLRLNGEVVVVDESVDPPKVDSVYTDWHRVLPVVVWGSQQYPEMRKLLPVRPTDAVDCRCRTMSIFVEGKVNCQDCGGLGWL